LSGDTTEQLVFCLLGSGKNGKSLFVNTLAEVAGEYACKIDSSVISMSRRGDGSGEVSKELYRMKGSRFVYTGEFNKNTLLNEALIKTITDGGKVSCRPLYGASVEYQPTYTLWFSTNNAPELSGFDEGIQRRFVLIPFDHYVAHPDKTLPQTLRDEASGILNWLAEGYTMYKNEGLDKPDCIAQAVKAYLEEQDVFHMFVNEYYTRDDNGKVYAKSVYEQYRTWCQYNGEKPVSQVLLSRELLRLGIAKKKDRNGIYYELSGRQYLQQDESA
jgi:putative DNA primase/helicase